ncbi:TM2 domain-containing protein [Saccharicrinis fermentans]|uniref:TM2 domain protein n=1 Tax=Saccharicrinis fermentans DSM 9555 = JCM 21142 TaxID=869213 RepID=W7YCJ9_9BACT|nr:NINE protein [Saccharicrinis fermentans]GAF05193.1 TM2 domain protein [Saccharicrinis fermentans DSM 9555 = JCM 21142]
MNRIINFFPDLELEEASFIDGIIQDYSDEEVKNFAMLYRSRRKDPQMILILALVGIFGVAGIHRFIINQVGMGVLYFLTGGLCLIGTIVDLVNYKSLAFEYNQKMAFEVKAYMSMSQK